MLDQIRKNNVLIGLTLFLYFFLILMTADLPSITGINILASIFSRQMAIHKGF